MKENRIAQHLTGNLNMKNQNWQLLLLDDDTNSFDNVMELLMEVLGHNVYQAEQCATLVHHKGECIVQNGDKLTLEMYKDMLEEGGLTVKLVMQKKQ